MAISLLEEATLERLLRMTCGMEILMGHDMRLDDQSGQLICTQCGAAPATPTSRKQCPKQSKG